MVIARINTYSASVFSLFHHEAERLREELLDGIRRGGKGRFFRAGGGRDEQHGPLACYPGASNHSGFLHAVVCLASCGNCG